MTTPASELAAAPPMALQTRETAADVLAAQAKALVEARYLVAIKQPRDFDAVRERLLKACRRPFFAKQAEYNKPIGEGIKGPSIRFAEEIARCMTNIIVEQMTVFDDAETRIVRVTVTDLEANFPWSQDVTIRKTVERSKAKDGDTVIKTRQNSQGRMVYILEATDDEILNKEGALVSKAARNLILRLAPGDLVEEGMKLCIKTAMDEDAKDPNAAKKEVFDSFNGIGISVENLKEYLGHDGTALQPKELADLRALFTAIRAGEATWRDAMEARGMAAPAGDGSQNSATATLTDRIKSKQGKPAADPAPVPATATSLAAEAAKAAKPEVAEEDLPFGRMAPTDQPTGAAKQKRRII